MKTDGVLTAPSTAREGATVDSMKITTPRSGADNVENIRGRHGVLAARLEPWEKTASERRHTGA